MENKTVYSAGAPPAIVQEAACECGWAFGRVIKKTKRPVDKPPYTVEYLVLYGANLRVFHLVVECPGCGKEFGWNGGRK